MYLLDSSALLAYLWGEPGSEKIPFDEPTGCTVANWSEVAAKVLSRNGDWVSAEIALLAQGLTIIPLETIDAVRAAELWVKHPFLSLGDRLCLAVGARLNATIITADRAWSQVSGDITLIR